MRVNIKDGLPEPKTFVDWSLVYIVWDQCGTPHLARFDRYGGKPDEVCWLLPLHGIPSRFPLEDFPVWANLME